MTNRNEKLAKALLRPINPAAVVLPGLYTFFWGLWVANPLWKVFTQAELFGFMAAIAPEWFWGCLAVLCGMVIVHGAWKRSYKSLTVGAATMGWHWSMIAVLYFIGDPLNTGGITSLFFAVYGAYIYLNIKINFRDKPDSPQILH